MRPDGRHDAVDPAILRLHLSVGICRSDF